MEVSYASLAVPAALALLGVGGGNGNLNALDEGVLKLCGSLGERLHIGGLSD